MEKTQCLQQDKSLKAAHRNSLVFTKLKFTKQIKKPEKLSCKYCIWCYSESKNNNHEDAGV